MSVRPSVCLSVSEHSHGWTDGPTILNFGTGIDLNKISTKFDGQGHRSKVKVTRLKNVIFWVSKGECCVYAILSWHLTSCDVTPRRHDVPWRHGVTLWRPLRLLGKNTDKEGTSREGASTLRRFHVNEYIYTVFMYLKNNLENSNWCSFKGLVILLYLIIQWKYSQTVVCFYAVVTFIWQRIPGNPVRQMWPPYFS